MLTTGQVIKVEVQTVAVFGIFCRHGEHEVLVRIPETSWIASYNSCQQFAEPGDQLNVKILHVDAATGQISASIKDVHLDPWTSDQLAPGTDYQAHVVRYIEKADRCKGGPGYLLELLPGAYVMLCAVEMSLKVGQQITVTVRESAFSNRSVRVVSR